MHAPPYFEGLRLTFWGSGLHYLCWVFINFLSITALNFTHGRTPLSLYIFSNTNSDMISYILHVIPHFCQTEQQRGEALTLCWVPFFLELPSEFKTFHHGLPYPHGVCGPAFPADILTYHLGFPDPSLRCPLFYNISRLLIQTSGSTGSETQCTAQETISFHMGASTLTSLIHRLPSTYNTQAP